MNDITTRPDGDMDEVVRKLSAADRAALMTLPLPGWTPHRVFVGLGVQRSYSSIWRKSSKHRDALLSLERRGIVERRESRGETLWRPARPFGLLIRTALEGSSRAR